MQLLDTGISSASRNMQLDENLLETLEVPTLHLYQWQPLSATYGYFTAPEKSLNLEVCKAHGLDLARRPTGGGVLFHMWDLAFSFLLPADHKAFSLNTLENYAFVNQAVLEVVQTYFDLAPDLIIEDGEGVAGFCMAKPTKYDVVWQGKKIAGAAQRRKRQGYLHQGTISLGVPDYEFLEKALGEGVVSAMRKVTFAPVQERELGGVRKDLEKLLAEQLGRRVAG